jgi:hypothetical protein
MLKSLTRVLLLSLFFMLMDVHHVMASIYCPQDKTIACHDNRHDLSLTGRPTAIGYPPAILKYVDNASQTNSCGVGILSRLWYIDINQNNNFDAASEGSCTQKITVVGDNSNIEITWPDNAEFTCKEDIVYQNPTWTTGPCDVMGLSTDTIFFNVAPDACYKIMRKFRIINWCTYQANNPNSPGIWEHTQIIKVIEKTPPTIADCTNKVIGVANDCKATFSIENSAADAAECSSDKLFWTVEIDLWADGTKDLTYGYLEKDIYYLAPANNEKVISITLPERIGVGRHKVYWSVKDQCANFSTCTTVVETKDLKPPTPYFHTLLTTAFDGADTLIIKPSHFEIGSYDNCTEQRWLRYAFSPNPKDTVRLISCDNVGFQFYEIYVFDEAGNADFAEVFMLAFDNGSCNSGNIAGKVRGVDGQPISGSMMELSRPNGDQKMAISSENGEYHWDKISIFDDYTISAQNNTGKAQLVDIADLKALQDYILGRKMLSNHQWIAADVNGDQKINGKDLLALKASILDPQKFPINQWYTYYEGDTIASPSDVTKLETSVKLIESKGRFDFVSVCRGDIITDALPPSMIDFIVSSDDRHLSIKPSIDNILGFHYRFKANQQFQNLTFRDENGIVPSTSIHYDASSDLVSIMVLYSSPENATLHIEGFEGDFVLENGSQILDVNNYLFAQRSAPQVQKPLSTFSIFPNPVQADGFLLSPKDYDSVQIFDTHGREVAHQVENGQIKLMASSGIYLCQVWQKSKKHVVKFVYFD